MSNLLSNVIAFTVGAAIGSAVTYVIVKKKYDQLDREDIDSIREAYSRGRRADSNPVDESCDMEEKDRDRDRDRDEEIDEMIDILKENGYVNRDEEYEVDKPYIITPDEFSEMQDYESIGLRYFTDEILADDDGNVVEDLVNTVGLDFAEHFNEYADDTVFVRNDRLKCDYEIVLDYRPYYKAFPRKRMEE